MWCPMMAGTLVVDKGRGGFGVRISVVGSNSVLVAPRGERKEQAAHPGFSCAAEFNAGD